MVEEERVHAALRRLSDADGNWAEVYGDAYFGSRDQLSGNKWVQDLRIAYAHLRELAANHAVVSVKPLSDEQRAEFRKAWKASHSGPGNEMTILQEGDIQ